ncbi:MAG: bifunctional adenosylcobinamide kinase/adenosylcobinamide-phosphate guanylyltransferase [Propionibacteriaceae bacterium]|jgi:adenosylcobinamide kinase/adenosylcobinamide-phosphate guanylyltransferase|nr:bifunctional adenosylcobinamide kinase/adenosylcobinamide-phosphate guanylyltransferase [Propionibacteriaceae bacterium]
MSVVLVTGGLRSGKSSHAEARIRAAGGEALYIATMVAGDEESVRRVANHRATRPASWVTWEAHRDLAGVDQVAPAGSYAHILLDCVSNLVTFRWFDDIGDTDDFTTDQVAALERACQAEIGDLVTFARAQGVDLYLVTNEVGWGMVPLSALGRAYADVLGRLNQHCAALADEVVLLVAGVPVRIK